MTARLDLEPVETAVRHALAGGHIVIEHTIDIPAFHLLRESAMRRTTLLRAVSGLLRVTRGKISFDGQDITNLAPRRIVDRGLKDLTTLLLSMVLLGGRGTIYGPLLAAFVLTFVSEAMATLGAWRPILIGVLIILVLLAYPGGLAGFLRVIRLRALLRPRSAARAETTP
jgi:hypothetical protein